MKFQARGLKLTFWAKSTCRPPVRIPNAFLWPKTNSWYLSTLIKVISRPNGYLEIFEKIELLTLNLLPKTFFIFRFVSGRLATPGSDFAWFLSVLKNFWVFDNTLLQPSGSTAAIFLFWKTHSAYFKTPCTHFQTCWDFMSRLKPKSESGGTKIWNSVKGGV